MKQFEIIMKRIVRMTHATGVWLGLIIKPSEHTFRYTFNCVGLDGRRIVVLSNHYEIAIRKAYSYLTQSELERLEWMDLEEIVRLK